ncbi:hypothetical protein GCM10011313_18580 [Mycetocola zhadangensis]|nr:hypothetical protein GCM10011313_18580 [Mycetocola zhadangensis]
MISRFTAETVSVVATEAAGFPREEERAKPVNFDRQPHLDLPNPSVPPYPGLNNPNFPQVAPQYISIATEFKQ